MKPLLLLPLAALVVVVGCDKPPRVPGMNGTGGNVGQVIGTGGGNNAGNGTPIAYTVHNLMDGSTPAFTYIMPKGWTSDDKLQWIQTSPAYPYSQLAVKSPDNTHSIAVFPMTKGVLQTGPMGSTGMSYENATDAIEKLIAADQAISNFTITSKNEQDVDAGPPPMPGAESHSSIAIVRGTFTEDGINKEGLFIARYDRTTAAVGEMNSVLWNVSLDVMAAPAGQLMSDTTFLQEAATMFTSATITPEYNQSWGQMSFQASQDAQKLATEQNKQIMENYWNQQKTMEKGMKDFDDYIRGVGTFGGGGGGGGNGNGGPQYQLPTGPGKYWIDPQGNIQHSGDPNYDPNQGGGGGTNWSPLNQIQG